ncbi:MAG TPA: glycosyltransferase family 4 protein [Candidatus Saccharimonadales bacterium]|nr:glycosyltransferase family 4 protein [Candidatus Saccharimonadales bacterium]
MQNKRSTIYISSYDDIKNPHYGGGGAVAVHEIAKRLSKKYDIRVICWDYCGKKKEVIEGIHYERFGISSLSPKIGMFVYQLALPFVALSKKYDLWMESFCPPFTTAFLPLFTKKPVVGIVHMLAAEDMERKYKLPFHLVQNFGLKQYKNILVTSAVLKKKIKAISPTSSIELISNGISTVFKPTFKKEKYILFLGRIEVNQKGIDLLISAFKKFHVKYSDYKLVIAGNGDVSEITQTKKLIKDAGLTSSVVLKGRVIGATKDALFKNTSCLIIPSRFETYSLVALEAMAYGAPVVHFKIEGLSWIPDIITEKAQPFDSNSLVSAMEKVITSRTVSEKMIKEGNAYAKKFTWDSVAEQYDHYIERILK